ncbi:MAG: hypothetical protein J6L59_01965 [Clostridia bacterium]|nr:hypothetical protein [Clostridia bacterium]
MSLGLSSLSYNSKSINEVIAIAKNATLDYIQWCDCHVALSDFKKAEEISSAMKKNGISCTQYYSSFDLNASENPEEEFLQILRIADILGTDSVCLRAGSVTYENADEEYLALFLSRLDVISKLAEKENKNISFNFLSGTLFDNYMTTISLLVELEYKNVFINWQPNASVSLLYSLFELKTLIKYVKNVNIVLKNEESYQPMIECQDDWRQYINILRTKKRYLFIETAGSSLELKQDVAILKKLLDTQNK